MYLLQLSVYLLSLDAVQRDSITLLLGRSGLRFQLFERLTELLQPTFSEFAGCLLIDQHACRDQGLAPMLAQIQRKNSGLPFLLLSHDADPLLIRQAFRAGALDVLPPDASDGELLAVIEEAFALERKRVGLVRRTKRREQLLVRLTPREREVARALAQGYDNHECAALLGISNRTVEVHKTRVMRKLNAPSLSHLIELLSGKTVV